MSEGLIQFFCVGILMVVNNATEFHRTIISEFYYILLLSAAYTLTFNEKSNERIVKIISNQLHELLGKMICIHLLSWNLEIHCRTYRNVEHDQLLSHMALYLQIFCLILFECYLGHIFLWSLFWSILWRGKWKISVRLFIEFQHIFLFIFCWVIQEERRMLLHWSLVFYWTDDWMNFFFILVIFLVTAVDLLIFICGTETSLGKCWNFFVHF